MASTAPPQRSTRGAVAESAAALRLERDGWTILARNLRTRSGELDLVALRRGRIAFVEVKARRLGGAPGSGEDALTPRKLRRVARAADAVLRARGMADAPREFLGIAVDLTDEGAPAAIRIVTVEEIQ